MSKQYATYHAEKGAVSSGGIGKHIDREPGAEHTYKHSDPERRHLNENILVNDHCKKPLHVGISDRIAEGYSAKNKAGELKAIRKDAVKYTTHILTGSHEQMKKIENDPQARKAWINANLDFIKREYGEKNIVRFSVHRDEKTMHIHAVTVPLTSDGRLSAKEVLGGRKEMSERQDRYAKQMKSFGLERGEKATGIKHENAREYYARMEKANNSVKENDFKAQKNAFGVYKSESVEELQNILKSQKTALKSKDSEIDRLKEQKNKDDEFKIKITENRKQVEKKLKETIQKSNEVLRGALLSPEKFEATKEKFKKEAWEGIKSDIRNSKEVISIQKMDEIIRNRIHEMNPRENVWTSLNTHFGEKAEPKIHAIMEEKNIQLQEKKQEKKIEQGSQYDRFDKLNSNRETKREQNQEQERKGRLKR